MNSCINIHSRILNIVPDFGLTIDDISFSFYNILEKFLNDLKMIEFSDKKKYKKLLIRSRGDKSLSMFGTLLEMTMTLYFFTYIEHS